MKELLKEILKIGGVNVLPFLVVAYAYWKQTQRFLDWQEQRLEEQKKLLRQNHKVITEFTNTINDLEEEIDETK